MAADSHSIASSWLAALTSAITSGDIDALSTLFLPDGWLRDLLVFTWDLRSLEGREKIRAFLSPTLSEAQVSSIKLDADVNLAPRSSFIAQLQAHDVEFGITFECRRGHGRGYVRLLPDAVGEYKALTVLMMLSDLHGYEETNTLILRDELAADHSKDASEEFEKWVSETETKPYVLIVGGAQTGLQLAARFKQMNIPTLVIERTPRVGDVWRNRYPSLTLHTPRRQHSLLYQTYPSNWPEYTPRDKLAQWIEHYAIVQDVVVWTNAELQPHPKYDSAAHEWDVTVLRNGVPVKLRPAHIVLATGTLGKPNVPSVPSQERFSGTVLHSSVYKGPKSYAGKRVVVVGAGNSAIDICQDSVYAGAESVTMIQRSSTCVMDRNFISGFQRQTWPEDVPVEVADLRWGGMPFGLTKKLSIATQDFMRDAQKELHAKLNKGGLKVDMGPDGAGLYILVLERLGGLWQDKGGADLIADGKIKVRNGVSPASFTKTGLVLSDGSELPADVVVYATGYINIRETNRALFGDKVIDQVKPIYGLDEEGEVKGSYRPSGHHGLWFATGDFFMSRFLSKTLALQLKAIQLGLLKQ
ncbi:dimethylaniline monooxygenase (N-oxide-forming) [Daedaleopsis nitida]|nr:dimethylaniline monooxygenase (N-oxide-forming) [Daedaleopsis nitida]